MIHWPILNFSIFLIKVQDRTYGLATVKLFKDMILKIFKLFGAIVYFYISENLYDDDIKDPYWNQ